MAQIILTRRNLETFNPEAKAPLVPENSGTVLHDEEIKNISDGSIISLVNTSLFRLPEGDSDFHRALKQYSPGTYGLGSRVQIARFNKCRWSLWDPEDEGRLMVYIVYRDMVITRGKLEPAPVKRGSLIFCSPYCPALHMRPANPCEEYIFLALPVRARK